MTGHAYPSLRPDSADYENPDRYTIQLQQKGKNLEVIHQLDNVHCLPVQWLREGHADLCCEVRAPQMLFNERYVAKLDRLQIPKEGTWEHRQTFNLPDTGNKSLYFLPAIVLRDARQEMLYCDTHDVTRLWDGREILFPRGALLAGGTVYEDLEKVFHLLRFELDPDSLGKGIIRTRQEEQDDEWQFVVQVSEDILEALQNPQHGDWANALYIGCLAGMLDRIKSEFKIVEPPSEAIRQLGEMLRSSEQAGRVAPPWDTDADNEEWIDTLKLATVLHKLRSPGLEENGE